MHFQDYCWDYQYSNFEKHCYKGTKQMAAKFSPQTEQSPPPHPPTPQLC